MTADLTPEGMRALIAEARGWADSREGWHAYEFKLGNRLADALEALLPREDSDLDTIEAHYWSAIDGVDVIDAVNDIPPLLAQVRTAEAALVQEHKETQAMKDYGDRAVHKLNELRFAVRDSEKARTAEQAEEWDEATVRAAMNEAYGRSGNLWAEFTDVLNSYRKGLWKPPTETEKDNA